MNRWIKRMKEMGKKGFTLIELLIVVVILAVLAAIVIPQFTSSTDEAKDAALKATLSQLRNAVELYYHQHSSIYPAAHLAADGSVAVTPLAADFVSQLTLYTNIAGKTQAFKDATFKYGPYLKSKTLPTNPIDELSTLVLNSGATLGNLTTATGTNAGGWWFDHVSGKFMANITAYYGY